MAERILIVGTGLIGGSVGMAARAAGVGEVRGHDRSPDTLRRALELGAVDEACPDLPAACEGVSLVVVATPVGQILPAVEAIASAAPPGTVVTDVGSTKAPIVCSAERLLGPQRPFVGGHPMAGSEREGISAARADLFSGALWILTPTADTDPEAFRRVNAFVAQLGARTLALPPDEHDRLVALVSHLPYALATVLMELADAEGDPRVFEAAAGSFRDVTRTAGSSPHVWRDILAANRDAILAGLDAFAGRLRAFRDALAAGEWDRLTEIIVRARQARRRIPLKGERGPRHPVVVDVGVPDRAGVLAEVTTTLGAAGINIEDLWMDHSGAGGTVHLVVDGMPAAERAASALRGRGYRPSLAPLEP